MKMASEVKSVKRELILNFNINQLCKVPQKEEIFYKWVNVIQSVEAILNNGKSIQCYQEIYMNINDLLLYDIPQETLEAVDKILNDFSILVLSEFKKMLSSKDFFDAFNPMWETVIDRFNLLKKLLNKYEKVAYGNLQKNNVYLICKLIIYIYNITIVLDKIKKLLKKTKEDEKIIYFFIQKVIAQVLNLRENIIDNSIQVTKVNITRQLSMIKPIVCFLCETGIYKENFNAIFLDETQKYYNKKMNELIVKKSLNDYMQLVEIIFEAENIIVMNTLNEISLKNLTLSLNQILIKDKTKLIFNKFFQMRSKNSIFNEQFTLLNKIYLLFKKKKIEDEIKKKFVDYINNCSNDIYKKYSNNYLELYNQLILFKNNIDLMISNSFSNDEKFKSLGKESLGKAINLKPNFIADYFSRYIDHLLTVQAKEDNDKILNAKIDEFMHLFKLLEAKDMFENFFISSLVNRCLYHLTISSTSQTYLIEQLKKECGAFFVTKSEEMISDINTSKELSSEFSKTIEGKSPFIINYYVLSNYSWPIKKIISGYVNDTIKQQEKKFNDFYCKKYSGKSLTWYLPYSNVEMEFKGVDGKYNLIANGVHCAILACFNTLKKANDMRQIVSKTKIEKENILAYIKPIVNAGILIYKKDNDTYTFNDNFKRNEKEITLINYNEDETAVAEKEDVVERTVEDRKYVIEAYVMRLLKQKKQMKIDELIDRVIDAVKFQCEREFVMSRITQLLDNRFITQDEVDENILRYV